MTVGSAPAMAERVRIAPDTTVGPVHLTVADLERSLDYYTGAIGMRIRQRAGKVARLGSEGHELLVLYEEPGARPLQGHTGLFHLALLLPSRADLARWLRHAVEAGVGLGGMSDHLVSEALYLRDPDGHGIEMYRDRPREGWPRDAASARRGRPAPRHDRATRRGRARARRRPGGRRGRRGRRARRRRAGARSRPERPPAHGVTVAAVVFDLDGVLLDSEVVWNEMKREVTVEAGGRWRDDAPGPLHGR